MLLTSKLHSHKSNIWEFFSGSRATSSCFRVLHVTVSALRRRQRSTFRCVTIWNTIALVWAQKRLFTTHFREDPSQLLPPVNRISHHTSCLSLVQCTMGLSVALRIWNISKCKGLDFAQFWSNIFQSSSYWSYTTQIFNEKYRHLIFVKNLGDLGKKRERGGLSRLKLRFLVQQNTALFSTFLLRSFVLRHRRDILTFLDILTVYTMKTIYFLNHLSW